MRARRRSPARRTRASDRSRPPGGSGGRAARPAGAGGLEQRRRPAVGGPPFGHRGLVVDRPGGQRVPERQPARVRPILDQQAAGDGLGRRGFGPPASGQLADQPQRPLVGGLGQDRRRQQRPLGAGPSLATRSVIASRIVGGTTISASVRCTHSPPRRTRSARSSSSRTHSSSTSGTPPVDSCRNEVNAAETGSSPSIDPTSSVVSDAARPPRTMRAWLIPMPVGTREDSRSSSESAATSSGR